MHFRYIDYTCIDLGLILNGASSDKDVQMLCCGFRSSLHEYTTLDLLPVSQQLLVLNTKQLDHS